MRNFRKLVAHGCATIRKRTRAAADRSSQSVLRTPRATSTYAEPRPTPSTVNALRKTPSIARRTGGANSVSFSSIERTFFLAEHGRGGLRSDDVDRNRAASLHTPRPDSHDLAESKMSRFACFTTLFFVATVIPQPATHAQEPTKEATSSRATTSVRKSSGEQEAVPGSLEKTLDAMMAKLLADLRRTPSSADGKKEGGAKRGESSSDSASATDSASASNSASSSDRSSSSDSDSSSSSDRSGKSGTSRNGKSPDRGDAAPREPKPGDGTRGGTREEGAKPPRSTGTSKRPAPPKSDSPKPAPTKPSPTTPATPPIRRN